MMVEQYLQDFSTQASKLTAVGVVILFVTALSMLLTIEGAFNQIWRVRESRKGIVSFLRFWAVLSLGPLLLGVGFVVSSYLTSIDILSRTASFVSNIIPGLRLIPLVFSSLAFTLLYVTVPNCKVPLRAGLYGGITAAMLFEAAKKGFGIFVSHFSSYKLIYGAFAAVPLFLLWIYLSWLIILFGVELTRAITVFRGSAKGHRHPLLTLLDILQLFYRRYEVGGTVSDVAVIKVLGRQDMEAWAEFARLLQEQRIIRKTEDGDYVLSRNLDQLDFWDFYRTLPWPLPAPADLEALTAEEHWAVVLRPVLERVQASLERELHLPLGEVLAGKARV
jgi:membrane protein